MANEMVLSDREMDLVFRYLIETKTHPRDMPDVLMRCVSTLVKAKIRLQGGMEFKEAVEWSPRDAAGRTKPKTVRKYTAQLTAEQDGIGVVRVSWTDEAV